MFLLNRRRFLRYSAASLLAAPFTRLLTHPARAAVPTGSARRLLVIFTPNGTIHNQWRPSGGGADFSFGAGTILEPLSDLRDELLVLDGLDFADATNHEGGMAAMLTGGGDTSIDQTIAAAIGGETRFRSLELGVQANIWGGTVQTRMSYNGGSYVTPDDDPLNVWSRLFGDLGDEVLLGRRQSVLDIANAELSDLQSRLGAAEQIRLEAHLESLRAVEQSLSGGGFCESPDAPSDLSATDNDNFPFLAQAQLNLAVQALTCGVTNVASVQLSHTVSPTVFSWLGESDSHHTLSHTDDSNASGVASFVACERWFAEKVAQTIANLAAQSDPETGESMLESTLVLWAREMGDGRLHVCEDVPWVLAGSAGGFFTPGRYLSLGGATHDQVLTSICNAFGLTNTRFGAGTAGALEVLR